MHRTLLWLAALPALVPAQTPQNLIGLTRTTPVLATADMTSCAIQSCVGGMGPAALPYAGGTAHDATTGITWVSNGTSFAGFDPRLCNTVCTLSGAPVPAGTVLTGLACYEPQLIMFVADSGNGITRLRLRTCPVTLFMPRCLVTGLQPNHVIGGLAASDTLNLLFYSGSDWSGGAPNNYVYVATYNNPCTPACRFQVPNCGAVPMGPITGLGFDDCRSVLWLTDGRQIMGLVYNRVTCTATQVVQCCTPAGLTEPFVGLCVNPSHATSLGTSCTNLACTTCTQMLHSTTGDPIVGNPAFYLKLDFAPAQQRGYIMINAGACNLGIGLPPWCGQFRVPLGNVILQGPITLGGTTGCTGSSLINLQVPNNVTLCGLVMSSQYLVLCQTTSGIGTGMSNCLSWLVSGS